jgi:hypothetical protein
MSLLAPIRSWWKALRHRSQTDREIEAELQFRSKRSRNRTYDAAPFCDGLAG